MSPALTINYNTEFYNLNNRIMNNPQLIVNTPYLKIEFKNNDFVRSGVRFSCVINNMDIIRL